MKKIMYGILIFLMMFLFVSNNQKTYALSNDEVVLIYVEAPEGWDTPHLWTWNEAGDSAFAILGWPGKAMIKDENNDGWFYLYVPKTMETAIINNGLTNDDAKQTEAFDLEKTNMWVVIALDDGKLVATTSTVKATAGDLPVFVDTIYIFALVPIDWDVAGVWAWTHPSGTNAIPGSEWPGTKMILQSDGWFILEVPAVANRVIINNFKTEGQEQTIDIDLLEGNNYVVVGELVDDKYNAETYNEKPIIIEEGITFYVTVPENWDAPNAWAWSHPDGTNLYPSWPGEKLTYNANEGVWVLVVPTWVNRVIINNEVDGNVVQTVDIAFPEGGEEYELKITEADLDGKYGFEVNIKDETGSGDIDPEPSDDKPISPWLWIGIGAAVLVIAAGTVLIFIKRKK